MRHIIYILSACFPFFLTSCKNETVSEEKNLSIEEKFILDSLSKVQQKKRGDSLKKKNPLLILPPDSNYTGDYVDKYPSGITKFKGFFRFGQRHGQWLAFYPDGLLWSELHFDKGLRHGPNTAYYTNNKMRYTGFYKNDLQDSTWIYYDSLGKIMKKVVFSNDRIVKELPVK